MGKCLSLLERLDKTLSAISSEAEKNTVYYLLYETGKKVLEKNPQEFYKKTLSYQTLIPTEEIDSRKREKEVVIGKELAKKLGNTILLPERGIRGYGRRYKKAIEKEYELLRNFYKEKGEDGENL